MTADPNAPQKPVITENDTDAQAGLTEVQNETQALIEAIRTKAQAEAVLAGEFTRESYLSAVRNIRENVEQTQLFDPEKIEASIHEIQQEAEKNWQNVVQDVQSFGDRLSEAAKAAWEILVPPEDKNDTPPDA